MTKISEADRKLYGALVILNMMVQDREEIGVALDGNDSFLEPLIHFLSGKGYIEVRGTQFVPTKKGRDVIIKFQEKYVTYLRGYDHFSAVDLQSGEFGIQQIHKFDLESNEGWYAWQTYLCSDRFTDLRVAIAELKGIDPVEIVFMSYLNEETILIEDGDGWQFNLIVGTPFDEIEEVVNSAWKAKDLDQSADGGPTGTQILENVIKAGTDVRKAVVEAEIAAQQAEEDEDEDDDVSEEYIVVKDDCDWYSEVSIDPWDVSYYDIYYDPYYVDPCFAIVVYDDDWYW